MQTLFQVQVFFSASIPFWMGDFFALDGRLKGSTLSQELKNPIILPKYSHITKLILSDYHVQICPQGQSQTLMVRVNLSPS